MRVQRPMVVGLLIMMTLSAVVLVGAVPAGSHRTYSLAGLPRLPWQRGAIVAGINDGGQVVATVTGPHRSRAVLYEDGRVVDLGVPAGFTRSGATGINASGVIAGQAWRDVRFKVPFVLEPSGGGYTWTRLPVPGRHGDVELAGIAQNGDVAGTVSRGSGANIVTRAVVWRSTTSGYPTPQYLSSGGWRLTAASGIVSTRWGDIVAGTSGRFTDTLWGPGGEWRGGSRDFSALNGIGGWGTHLYAFGRFPGIDTSYGWTAPVHVSRNGRASLGPKSGLPFPKGLRGVECFFGASAISAGAAGRMVAVGSLACISLGLGRGTAVLWRNGAAHVLQSDVKRGSGWKLTAAQALNTKGQIAGIGTLHGVEQLFVLTPTSHT